jgi:hypothetical protein
VRVGWDCSRLLKSIVRLQETKCSDSGLWYGRRQLPRRYNRLEPNRLVGVVTKGFGLRLAAPAQGDPVAAGEVKHISLRVFENEIAFDLQRTVRLAEDFNWLAHLILSSITIISS